MPARFTQFTGVQVLEFFAQLNHNQTHKWFRLPKGDHHEWVFARRVHLPDAPKLELSFRVCTTIDPHTEIARPKGDDAIRCQLWWGEPVGTVRIDHMLSKGSDVKRTQGWRKGIQDRLDNWLELIGPPCPKCKKPTGRKETKAGHFFYGCVAWRPKGEGCDGSHEESYQPHTVPQTTAPRRPVNLTPPCPKCQGAMTVRNGPRGQFWGCKQYPKCNGTLSIAA